MSHSEMVMEMIQRGQFSISRKHIEDLRPWRGILLPHVRQALQSGSVISCSQSSAILRGSDSDGRILELPLKPLSLEFRIQNSWTNAELVHVMTAYIRDGHTNETIRQLIYKLKQLIFGGHK